MTGTPQSARQKNAHHPHPQHRCQEPQMAPWTPSFKIKVSKQEQIRAKYRLSSGIAKQIIDQAKAKFCRKISIILGQMWADTNVHPDRVSLRCTESCMYICTCTFKGASHGVSNFASGS